MLGTENGTIVFEVVSDSHDGVLMLMMADQAALIRTNQDFKLDQIVEV